MGSGFALDMAKKNKENLSHISPKGLYKRLKDYSSKPGTKEYRFKKATPQLLEAIKNHHTTENHKIRIKKIVLFGFIMISISAAVYAGVMFVF